MDSIDPHYVKVRGIFTHLGYLSDGPVAPITKRIQKFLRIACPVAAKIASSLTPEDPPIMVHWAASSELSRLRNSKTGKLQLPPNLRDYAKVCMSNPKVKFGIRVGSATYGDAENLPKVQPVLWWTSPITKLLHRANTTIAIVNIGTDDGYPRFFKHRGKWGYVNIGDKRYALAAPPKRHSLEVDVGINPDPKKVFEGAEVCLLCDNPSISDLYHQWISIEPHNIATCVTGVSSHLVEESTKCAGPVIVVKSHLT